LAEPACDQRFSHRHVLEQFCGRAEKFASVSRGNMRRDQYVTGVQIDSHVVVRSATGERCTGQSRFDYRFGLRSLVAIANEQEMKSGLCRQNSSRLRQYRRPVPGTERSDKTDDGLVIDTKRTPKLASPTSRTEAVWIDSVGVYDYL